MKPQVLLCAASTFASVITVASAADSSSSASASMGNAPSPSTATSNVGHYQDSPAPQTYVTSPGFSTVSPFLTDSWRTTNFYSSPYRSPVRVLYPAPPPALGELNYRPRQIHIRKNDVESELSSYVTQSFYAPLSGLLTSEDLSSKRRKKLQAFHVAQTELLVELRARLESLHDSPPETRRQELSRLAQQQAPRLAQLETQEENLRSDFVHGGFFSSSVDWNEARDWRLGDDLAFESQQDEARVMRAAAYFQDGLSEPQRRLLRELAIELAEPISDPTAEIALDQPKPYIFFSPETARIRLPSDMPADLSEKIDAYNREKAALKRELRDVVYAKDRSWFSSRRTSAAEELAQRQATRIAALDTLADEIREGLSALPDFNGSNLAALPPTLVTRIQHYSTERLSLENAYAAKRAEVFKKFSGDRIEIQRSASGVSLALTPSRRTLKKQHEQAEDALAELAAFNTSQTSVYQQLAKEKDAIRRDVADLLRQKSPFFRSMPTDTLLLQFGKIFEAQLALEHYGEYQTAVLEPGLSPAQRRLLFGAALERLRLPPVP